MADDMIMQQQLALARLLEMADLMLKGAKEQQWGTVIKLQELRDRQIQDFFAQQTVVEEQRLAEGIKYILESDKQLAKLVRNERSTLQAEIQKMKEGKKAVNAYSAK